MDDLDRAAQCFTTLTGQLKDFLLSDRCCSLSSTPARQSHKGSVITHSQIPGKMSLHPHKLEFAHYPRLLSRTRSSNEKCWRQVEYPKRLRSLSRRSFVNATTYICNHSFLPRLVGTDSVALILERITETSRTLLLTLSVQNGFCRASE